jgi:hypothetical protein
VTVKGFKRCCISDEMDGRVGEAGNVDSEHESVSSERGEEVGKCEDIQAATNNRNGEQSETDDAGRKLLTSRKKRTQINGMYKMFSNIYFFHVFAVKA